MGDHMKVFIFQVQITVCMVLQTTLEFPLHCPTKLFWNARARKQCQNETLYHCLLDGKSKQYIETCLHPKPYRKGLRAVHNLNLDAKTCSKDRFSPHHIMSNAEYSCPFIKSNCTDEGQILIQDGSPEADRTCRCDYTRGYDYINRPKDPCRCRLGIEMDCSCYLKPCPKNAFLSPDYECHTISVISKYTCNPIDSQRLKEESSSKTNITSFNEKENYQDWGLAVCRVLPIWLLFLLAVIILCLVSEWDMKKLICSQTKENKEENFHIDPMGADEASSHIVTTQIHREEKTTNTTCNETKERMSLTRDETMLQEMPEQQIECIFRQVTDMVTVPYYQKTIQFDKVKMHFEKGSRLVILAGPPGAGKTQTAHHYCNKMKEKYSIVAKFVATDDSSLLSSLKGLLKQLKVPLDTDENENMIIGSLLKSLSDYLNHSSRKACLYLILIDDIHLLNQNLIEIIRLLEFVQNLKFLLTTYDSTLKNSYVTACMVSHNGMDEEECLQFFKQSRYFANVNPCDIKEIANKTGTIPLALNCARQFLETTKKSIKSYLLKFNEDEDAKTLENIVSLQNPFYRYSLLQSQRIPLEQIKENIDERLWEVFMLLPLLKYSSISNDVLEACCYHLSKDIKLSIDDIICHCSRFSVCHTLEIPKHRLSAITKHDVQNSLSWSFHTVTILALKWMDTSYQSDDERKRKQIQRLTFLLKFLSFEINIDTKDNITLERNLLFLSHAIKILDRFEQMNQEEKASDEVRIYLAYLNCAVGKTLLFEGTDVKLAHKYLMTSRDLCLLIVSEESFFKKDLCLYPNFVPKTDFKRPEFSKIGKTFKSFCNKTIDADLIKEFILSKRRSPGEIGLLQYESKNRTICENGYLRDNEYKYLVEIGLAIPHTVYKNLFLIELFLHILFDNGRALNELRFITDKKDYVRQICNFEFYTCNEFCKLLKASDITKGYKILLFLDNDRSVKSYIRWTEQIDISVDEIDLDIKNINDLSISNVRVLLDFGIAKMSQKTNDHHVCICCKLLLKNMVKKLKSEKDEHAKKEIFEEGRTVVVGFLERIEINKEKGWLALPLFYIQCGKFLLLSTDDRSLEQSLHLFECAITAERNRQNKWTRFLWEGYYGKFRCLSKLFRRKEAKDIYDILKNELKGTGRDTMLSELELIIWVLDISCIMRLSKF